MRRVTGTVLAVLLLVVLAVAVDRGSARVAERAVATRVAAAGGLAAAPDVDVRGRPFLTQAARGRYDDVVVRADGVQAGALRVSSLVAQLRGVDVPLRDVVSGRVEQVPVDAVTARAVVRYADLAPLVADRGLGVAPAGDGLARVTARVTVAGRTLEATAVSRPTLEGRALVLTAERFEVGSGIADAVLSRALGSRLDFRVDVGELPYGLALTDLRAAGDGVVLQARSDGAVLRR